MASSVPSASKRYVIQEVLGKGGMGLVYRAYDNETRRHVTLKTLLDIQDLAALELFRKECEVLAHINHPNIVDIYDIGELQDAEGKKPYFVMPLLPGSTLDRLISSGSHRLTVERTVDIMAQAARGLQAAHDRGLVHRDVKPSNIFVLEDDSVKIIDFGVAHLAAKATQTSVKGTLHYMAPEQLQMQKPTAASDLFSLGVVCYEALTRRKPFEGATAEEVVQNILHHSPPPASDLNPAVNRALSQVIHKALAKQAFHRFSSAREFGDLLQKALRGEALEVFDESRMVIRIERARKALDSGELEFAGEVLGGLEAEGYIHPDMAHLRQQINRTRRDKTIGQLLENAQRCFREEEYQLALQKIEEVLRIDPHHTDAITLKAEIENKRSSEQISRWLTLAQQHMDNHAYGHARQALEDVLQLKPDDTQARKMLALVKSREQDYVRTRKEKEELYQAALEAWKRGELSSALSELERVLLLDRRAPDTTNPERAASYQKAYNQIRSDHDTLKIAYDDARRQLNQHNFKAALGICDEALLKYPGHALLQALKVDIEEAQRQNLSAFIARIDREVETEPDLDRRVSILREALAARPGETHFERSLQLTLSKRDLVNSIVAKARTYEEKRQFNEALNQWEMLRTIYTSYPGLDFEVERVTKRRDQQLRSEAKASWVEKIDHSLSVFEWQRALDLTQNALGEFQDDPELKAMEQLARQGLARASEAQALLDQGRALCTAHQLDEGVRTLRRAFELDERDGRIRAALLDGMLKQARALLESDPAKADQLTGAALELEPSNALAKSLRTLLDDRKRGQFVDECLARARGQQAAGDVEAAMETVRQALTAYPQEARLLQLRASLDRIQTDQQRAVARRRDLDEIRGLEAQSQKVADSSELRTMLEQTVHIANRYSGDKDFEQIVSFLRSRVAAVSQPEPAPLPLPEVFPSRPAPAPEPPQFATEPVSRPAPAATAPVAVPLPPPAEPVQERAAAGRRMPVWWFVAAGTALLVLAGVFAARSILNKGAVDAAIPVEIKTEPAGVNVHVDGALAGVAPGRMDLRPGKRSVRLSFAGYRSVQREWDVVPGFVPPVERLDPLPARVLVASDAADAKVILDGAPSAASPGTPLEFADVSLNSDHKLAIAAGDTSAEVSFKVGTASLPEITLTPGRNPAPLVVLSRLGSGGRLYSAVAMKVSSDGGKSFQDSGPGGLALGQIPDAGLVVDDGTGQRTLPVETSEAPSLQAYLISSKAAAPLAGSLQIQSSESDFRVLVDGKPFTPRKKGDSYWLASIRPGGHKIEFSKEGFKADPESARVDVKAGESARLAVTWSGLPAMLVLEGAVPGTQVVAGGKVIATANANGEARVEVQPGTLDFDLRKPGYRSKPQSRAMRAGAPMVLAAPLSRLELSEGTLTFRVEPRSGVTLELQQTAGVVQYNGPKKFAEAPAQLTLPQGRYNFHFSAPGYRTETFSAVELADAQQRALSVKLERRR